MSEVSIVSELARTHRLDALNARRLAVQALQRGEALVGILWRHEADRRDVMADLYDQADREAVTAYLLADL